MAAHPKQWFTSLTHTHGLIDRVGTDRLRNCVVVAASTSTNKFTYQYWSDYFDFYRYLLAIPEADRRFHEVILPDVFRKPYFAVKIDARKFPLPEGHTVQTLGAIVQEALIQGIRHVLCELKADPEFDVAHDVAIYSSYRGDERFSIHIALPRHRVFTHMDGAEFCRRVLHVHRDNPPLYEHLKKAVDTSVYAPNRSLRMYGSSTLLKTFMFEGVEYHHETLRVNPKNDPHAFSYYELLESLITFTGFADNLVVPVEPRSPDQVVEVLKGDLALVMNLVYMYTRTTAATYPYVVWNPKDLGKGKLFTRRINEGRDPVYCPVCNCTHRSNTPWIKLRSPKDHRTLRHVYYGCFSLRSPYSGKGVYLGELPAVKPRRPVRARARIMAPPPPPPLLCVAGGDEEEFEIEI
jgi:hypothetical protein